MKPEDIDWDNLGFDYMSTKTMFWATKEGDKPWTDGELKPFGTFEINPAACVLNYGQGVFEGMKAQRTKDDLIVLFRPLENGKRFKESCERLCLPPFDPEKFVYWVKEVVKANKEYVPPYGKGALYIRPIIFGSGPI
ncbi:MAG: branched chain amino acid aminotransferase, partial [Candidatus Helarchaeota archaeon]|nr:branched chain amino acid aminotransferase [Candidatus Helarchaeota archaeon]